MIVISIIISFHALFLSGIAFHPPFTKSGLSKIGLGDIICAADLCALHPMGEIVQCSVRMRFEINARPSFVLLRCSSLVLVDPDPRKE